MSSELAAVVVNGVSKRYELYSKPADRLKQFLARGRRQYYKEHWALRDVSLRVAAGESFALLGRNGSGKSTLLQIIAGTLGATAGTVAVSGRMAALLELGAGFNPEFTGRENVWTSASLLGLARREIDERFEHIVDFAEIGDYLDQPVKAYSSGMYVRLAFAVQACIEPDVLIVDEALAVGDEKFQRKCFEHLDRLREKGCAIVLVTHATQTVEKFCQQAALLHEGIIHGVGPANEIVDQYHALLYSDERAYLRYLNAARSEKAGSGPAPGESGQEHPQRSALHAVSTTEETGEARINGWRILDDSGEPCEVFRVGDRVRIGFAVGVWSPLREVQGGILLRTTEGVSAFGTSTLYAGKNLQSVEPAQTLHFSFDVKLQLSPGSYFLTLAVAEAISEKTMRYLDRRTDVVVLKISDPRAPHTGIAALDAEIDSWVESVEHE